MKVKKITNFEEDLALRLKNKNFKREYEAFGRKLEIAYRVAELRAEAKLSQAAFARKIGTKQSNIARMEHGEQNFTLDTLQKIASVFGKKLEISFA